MNGSSLDIIENRLTQLKSLFPEAFTEGEIDFKRFRHVLGDSVSFQKEHYELSWAGKSEARKEVQKQTSSTLALESGSIIDQYMSGNVFIEGENLEVLRVLQKSYFGKIKLIYIDPPYNTGNDSFIYPDDYSERKDEYKKRAGITNEDGYLNKQDLWKRNSKESGHFHSVWLSMMYPRLFLARNLMKEDGVIFVSIDDNEQANLKLLMDEVFGEENFIANVIWEKKFSPQNDAKYFSDNHDFILVYAKNKDLWKPYLLKRKDEHNARYSNPDNDPRGVWTSSDCTVKTYTPTYDYAIATPSGKEIWPTKGRCWFTSKEGFQKLIAENRIWFGESGKNVPRLKKFLNEVQDGIVPLTIWKHSEVGHNQEAKQEFKKYFETLSFDSPKPTRLIKRILELSTKPNEEDIVLDFFAGSGTTAQAVLELNSQDGGNRKFILIQLPEPVPEITNNSPEFKTIADISKTRIQKVVEEIQTAKNAEFDFDNSATSLDFKVFKLAPSNFKQWQNDISGEENLLKQLEVFITSTETRNPDENMLAELLLKSGKPLNTRVTKMETIDGSLFYLPDYNVCICIEGFGVDSRTILFNMVPKEVIILSSLFKSDEMLSNTKLEFNEANIKLTLI